MKHYFSSLFFTVIAIVATIATVATGENNFLCTVVFGTFAVGDAWNTTKRSGSVIKRKQITAANTAAQPERRVHNEQ